MVHVRNLPDSTETVTITGVLHSSSIMSFWDPKKKPLPTKFGPQRPFSNIVVSQARVSRDPDQDPALDSPLYDHILSDLTWETSPDGTNLCSRLYLTGDELPTVRIDDHGQLRRPSKGGEPRRGLPVTLTINSEGIVLVIVHTDGSDSAVGADEAAGADS